MATLNQHELFNTMKHLFLPLAAAAFLFSCGGNESDAPDVDKTDTTADATQVDEPKVEMTETCYEWIVKKDTISLKVVQTGNMVTGELHYKWFEKDSNHGDIKGEMKGDTLIVDYTFMSEGMESVRKEFFLKKDGGLVIGQPDYEHQQEPFKAKDVKYDGMLLKPVDCK